MDSMNNKSLRCRITTIFFPLSYKRSVPCQLCILLSHSYLLTWGCKCVSNDSSENKQAWKIGFTWISYINCNRCCKIFVSKFVWGNQKRSWMHLIFYINLYSIFTYLYLLLYILEPISHYTVCSFHCVFRCPSSPPKERDTERESCHMFQQASRFEALLNCTSIREQRMANV